MGIASILLHLDLQAPTPALLHAAVDLAERFGAELIGFAGDEPSHIIAGYEGGAAIGEAYAQERATIEEALTRTEQQFRSAVPGQLKSQWRGLAVTPTEGIISLARCADLIVTATSLGGEPTSHAVDIGDLLLRAGRPILAVAAGTAKVNASKVVVGWKDSRESRRAVADALPFLKAADEVFVITVEEHDYSAEWSSLNDVVHWLELHGVRPRGEILPMAGSAADTIVAAAAARSAELVVTGGYGHSRLREWLFGGVTRDLLATTNVSRLLSN